MAGRHRLIGVNARDGSITVVYNVPATDDPLDCLKERAKKMVGVSRDDPSKRIDAILIAEDDGRAVFAWSIFDAFQQQIGNAEA